MAETDSSLLVCYRWPHHVSLMEAPPELLDACQAGTRGSGYIVRCEKNTHSDGQPADTHTLDREVQMPVPSPFAARCYLCSKWMPSRTRVAHWPSDEMMACITCYMGFWGWLETRLNLGHLLQRWNLHCKVIHKAHANRALVHVRLWQQGDWQVWVKDFTTRWVVTHAIRAWHEAAPLNVMPGLADSSSSYGPVAAISSPSDSSEDSWA